MLIFHMGDVVVDVVVGALLTIVNAATQARARYIR
jgi:type III secretory pathway component EscS